MTSADRPLGLILGAFLLAFGHSAQVGQATTCAIHQLQRREQCSDDKAQDEATANSKAACGKPTNSTSRHRDAEESDSKMIMHWLDQPNVLAAFVYAYGKAVTRGARSWN